MRQVMTAPLVIVTSALLLVAALASSAGAQDIRREGSDGKPGDPTMRPPSSRPRPPVRHFFPCCVAYLPPEPPPPAPAEPPILYVAPTPPTLIYVPTPRVEPAPEIQGQNGRYERHGNGKEYPYTWVWVPSSGR